MTRRIALALTMLIALSAGTARAQGGLDPTGAWSWSSPGQFGMDANTVLFQGDGRFVRESRWGNGVLVRNWGQYRLTVVGPGRFRLDTKTEGWLPRISCMQVPGFAPNCRDMPGAPDGPSMLTFTSAQSFAFDNGLVATRDPQAALLQQPVPERLFTMLPAAQAPAMRQPVAPAAPVHVVPNGPGQEIARRNHEGADNFINGYQRGCVKDIYGRWVGCQQ